MANFKVSWVGADGSEEPCHNLLPCVPAAQQDVMLRIEDRLLRAGLSQRSHTCRQPFRISHAPQMSPSRKFMQTHHLLGLIASAGVV